MPRTTWTARARSRRTSWSVIRQAHDHRSSEYADALQKLIRIYWKPVYCFIRYSWRRGNEDAKDLTQEFFARIVLQNELVRKFIPERGSFRAFLKASVTNFMNNEIRSAGRKKRGGDVNILALETLDFDPRELVRAPREGDPEKAFDEAWRTLVLQRSLERLEERLRQEGKEIYFEVFRRYELDPEQQKGASYKTLGETLGLSMDAVKNYLTRAREAFRDAVTSIVAEYVDNEEDLFREIDAMLSSK